MSATIGRHDKVPPASPFPTASEHFMFDHVTLILCLLFPYIIMTILVVNSIKLQIGYIYAYCTNVSIAYLSLLDVIYHMIRHRNTLPSVPTWQYNSAQFIDVKRTSRSQAFCLDRDVLHS